MRVLAKVALAILVVSLIPGSSGSSYANRAPSFDSSVDLAAGTCWHYKRSERRFVRKMNNARENVDKTRMRKDPELSKVARKHTWEMVNKEELYHTPSTTLAKRVTHWSILGENVGVGGSVESLHEAFMNSPAHRSNILYTSFKFVGVGVVKRNGRMWVTVIFEAAQNPGTKLNMPDC
jgi:uncharacterized protein YkwD